MRIELNTFRKRERESLYDAWERYKDLQRDCPHHGTEYWFLVQDFYNGLLPSKRSIVDSAIGGDLIKKIVNEALELLESVAYHNFEWSNE